MHLRVTGALLLMLFTIPSDASAQATDSLPFRAAQWGAEFTGAGGGFTGAGVMRFLNSERALVLDLAAAGTAVEVSGPSADLQGSTVQLRLGHRWYRAARPKVVQSFTLGASAFRTSAEPQFDPDEPPSLPGVPFAGFSSERQVGGGAFAELGAAWLISDQLALGASWGGSLQYSVRTTETPSLLDPLLPDRRARITRWNASVGTLVLRVSLFF